MTREHRMAIEWPSGQFPFQNRSPPLRPMGTCAQVSPSIGTIVPTLGRVHFESGWNELDTEVPGDGREELIAIEFDHVLVDADLETVSPVFFTGE